MKQIYSIILTPEKEGGFSALVPDLQFGTQGETIVECIDMARDAIGLWGICEQDAGREIPTASVLSPDHAQDEIVTLVDVDFDAYRRANGRKFVYPACFYQDPETGNYTVEVPDLPGCVSGGPTLDEAILMAEDAASGWVLDELEKGNLAPQASNMTAVTPDEGGFVRLLSLDIDAYAKKYGNKAILKNLTIPAWLNTFGEKRHLNFSQVLTDALTALYQQAT